MPTPQYPSGDDHARPPSPDFPSTGELTQELRVAAHRRGQQQDSPLRLAVRQVVNSARSAHVPPQTIVRQLQQCVSDALRDPRARRRLMECVTRWAVADYFEHDAATRSSRRRA